MSRRALLAVCVYAGITLATGSPGQAQVRDRAPVTDAMLQDPDPADWLSWRRTLDGWGYSPLDEIDRGNVDELRLAWSWGLEPGVSQTTPIVHDGFLYVANPGNVVQALDARTGDFVWEYRREMDERLRSTAQMRSLAVYQDLVILNTYDAHIVGLDVRTGEVRWETPVGGDREGYTFSSGPIVVDGTIVAGMTGCGRYRDDTCYIVGVDGRTGRLLWRTSTIARPGEAGGDTWGDLPLLFRAGSDAWMTGSYDPVTRLVYWGTSQPKPHNRDARGTDGDALYSNSTLALDPATGEMEWYYQHIPGDSHDMDESFERILIDYDGKRSLFSMGKLGILWELDRVTGEFRRAIDLGYQNILDVDPRTGEVTHRDGMLSDVGEEIFFCPSTGGFKSLRAMAYHPGTGALYVPLNLSCETAAFAPVERRAGGGGGGSVRGRINHFHPQAPDQLGEFRALDVRTGETLWRHRLRVPYNTSALTTGGGLVFIGDWGRRVYAYDARTGEQLWRSRLSTMANGYPITYAVDGEQFVAFVAGPSIGGSSWATILPGDLLRDERNPRGGSGVFAFALPAPQSPDLAGIVRVTIEVELSCPSCAAGLERRLRRMDYVSGVEVDPSDGRIVLAVEPGRHLDPAAVWDTVRNAGFLPDRMAVTAIGHVIDRNGTPALALSPDFALPLVAMDGLAATATEAGDQLVRVTGDWNASPDGAGRLRVESFEVRWQLPPSR